MNRIFGYCSFQKPIDPELVNRSRFRNTHWAPDHQGHFVNQQVVFTSTQRFITPECHRLTMPYVHEESGYLLVADAYLTQRAHLCTRLHVSSELADAELIFRGYLKWGVGVLRFLSGEFCVAIWNPHDQSLFLATDQFCKRPLLYAYKPGHFIAFSNEISPFRALNIPLTINENMFAHFALDSLPGAETCYQEVLKVFPGHYLHITSGQLKQQRYWCLSDQRKRLPYRTREAYDAAFQTVFQVAVHDALRSDDPITAHISGGLDSSAVAAQAAVLLAEKQRTLEGITALPNGLEGPSYRKGWHYHEMPLVQTLLDRYPNIRHKIYRSSPETNMHEVLKAYYPLVDQPFRNISNLDWIIGSYNHARTQGGRVILTGSRGNGSISWAAYSWKRWLLHWAKSLQRSVMLDHGLNNFFENCPSSFLKTKQAKSILRRENVTWTPHQSLLSTAKNWPRHSSSYAFALSQGILSLDPTHDLAVVEFCYNVPDWVCREGKSVLENRLLVRRGLSHVLPEAITNNPFRGEQAADWFMHYKQHAAIWHAQLEALSDQTKARLDHYYDPKKYAKIQDQYALSLKASDASMRRSIDCSLMRYMSAAFFLDYLASDSRIKG
jgi:asparagine synthase (glutamine-hydrolysing)